MPQPEVFSSLRIPVELSRGGKAELPTEFKVLNNGATDTLKGKILCSEYSCQRVLDAMKAAGRDKLPFDYNHEMLAWMGGDGRAAGWFKPASRDGELWATEVEWTPRAKAELDAKEWRYFSPALFRDDEGNITELINIALTNLPATLNQDPLVTSRFNAKDNQDMTLEQLLAACGAKDAPALVAAYNAAQADVAKKAAEAAQLIAASQELQTKLNAAVAEVAALKAAGETEKKRTLISQLSAAGKLPPALHKWAEGQTIAQLEEYGAGVSPAAAAAPPVQPAQSPVSAPAALTVEELSVCKQFNLDPAEYLKGKAERAAQLSAGGDPKVLADMGLPRFKAQKAVA